MKKTKATLLKEFKSVKRIKEAGFEDIEKVIGTAKAKLVIEKLKPNIKYCNFVSTTFS